MMSHSGDDISTYTTAVRHVCVSAYFPSRAHHPQLVNSKLPEELRYACKFWIGHIVQVRNSTTEQHLLEKVDDFLWLHALHWIEACSLLGVASEVMENLTRLRKWIIVSLFLGLDKKKIATNVLTNE